jgi:hypothetical protein
VGLQPGNPSTRPQWQFLHSINAINEAVIDLEAKLKHEGIGKYVFRKENIVN